MYRCVFIITTFIIIAFSFSFLTPPTSSPGEEVKRFYLELAGDFIREARALQTAFRLPGENIIQQQFKRAREAYKRIEPIVEYYFSFYAVKLNGPPILFFEEDESDVPENQPYGMQVIEGLLFPHRVPGNEKKLKLQIDQLVRYAIELPTITESFAFNDANNFDAFVEELFRITALGITGFDSQTLTNSLPECRAAINSLQQFFSFYKINFDDKLRSKYDDLQKLLTLAQVYLEHNSNFTSFNRMEFITRFLDPITKIVGEYKRLKGLPDNPSGEYFSAINKNNSLFSSTAFNTSRFLDDFTTSPKKIELGRKLFFDTQLSSNNKRSCASCHQPGKAFTDGLKTSLALDGHSALLRNAPTLWNAALQRNLFVDSRSHSLEDQVLQVLNNAKEMHGSAETIAEKIILQDNYSGLYQKSYPAAGNAAQNICNAIACFERTLVALNSRFDRKMNGQNTMNKNEITGFNLFMGKAKCGTCHFMPLFSGSKPPRYYYIESEVIGVPVMATKLNPRLDADSGRYLVTKSRLHLFSFKTPSLRNVALTAPYMHNGVFKTLDEVIEFYNKGGGKGLHIAPKNQTLPFDKLNLSGKEKKDIIAFLYCLTDTTRRY